MLTYAELDGLIGAIGARLLESVSRPPRRIGLLVSRSRTAYCAYLAVLRLGATPVPLNVGFPQARNKAIASAARLDLVICDHSGEGIDVGVPELELGDEELDALRPIPAVRLPPSAAGLDDFGYILFTSGSTGTPKGVPLTHRNLSSFIAYVRTRYPAGPGARLSQVAELTFDPSVQDMFLAWSTGAALVVPARWEILTPADFVNRRRLTHWFSVPSVISMAYRVGDLAPGVMQGLRYSMFSGEPLTMAQAAIWQAAAPNSTIDNLYGPTELTGCYEYRLPRDRAKWPRTGNGSVPIGRAYPGMEHLILGEDGKPARQGELMLRGAQRFPGYLDPAQDDGRYLIFDGNSAQVYHGEKPLSEDYWYRTGDLVEVTSGVMLHLGRLDYQVKVRGHRVEIGEIEELLRGVEGVREAVVLAKKNGQNDVELRGALTGLPLDTADVLRRLRNLLPDYMIPSMLINLDELPLNFNGKIDRSALTKMLFPE